MKKLLNYSTMGLIIIVLLLTAYTSSIKNQRDNIQHTLTKAEQQISQLADMNRNLSGSIDLLEKQAQQNRRYMNDLEQKRLKTQQQTNQQTQKFKRLKNENKIINTWANQSLPNGMY